MRADQAVTVGTRRLTRGAPVPHFDGTPRFALLTVNFSTTRYLKLMLLTLAEQRDLSPVARIVIVDHRSRDGGLPFLRELARRVERVHLVERGRLASHARGMRRAVRAVGRSETGVPFNRRANLLLFCDPDVIFLNADTVSDLATAVVQRDAALAGEFRGEYPDVDVQASLLTVRSDCSSRPDVMPIVHHGSPTRWMQRSIGRAGLPVVNFPSYRSRYVLHRGRSAVEASRELAPLHAYATVEYRQPHFMGVPDGPRLWAETEARFTHLLDSRADASLLVVLSDRLAALGEA